MPPSSGSLSPFYMSGTGGKTLRFIKTHQGLETRWLELQPGIPSPDQPRGQWVQEATATNCTEHAMFQVTATCEGIAALFSQEQRPIRDDAGKELRQDAMKENCQRLSLPGKSLLFYAGLCPWGSGR